VWLDDQCVASQLLAVEARCVLHSRRLSNELAEEDYATALADLAALERTLAWIPISRTIMRRAGQPFGLAVRALDAVHLASALATQRELGSAVRFATHDVRQARGARALGFEVIGVEPSVGP
jgi:hypothetical protein